MSKQGEQPIQRELVMAHKKATISLDGKVLAENVDIHMNETLSPNGMIYWDGDFFVPPESPIAKPSNVIKTHHLALDDGRQGDFLMSLELRNQGSQSTAHVKFQGTGTLAAPVP